MKLTPELKEIALRVGIECGLGTEVEACEQYPDGVMWFDADPSHFAEALLAALPKPNDFEHWHKANAKYMEQKDIVPWCQQAWEDSRAALPKPEPVEIIWPEYHAEAMGCGLEDRNITNRYEAMRHGWDCAMERAVEALPEVLYTSPPVAPEPEGETK